MPDERSTPPRLPPRWFIRSAWQVHRALVRVTRGRRGLWEPKPDKWGALRLTTVGRRTGQPRKVIIAYLTDGPDLVGMAMNGWGDGEPAWWLNLQANPDATVECTDGLHLVRARPALGEERTRLWTRLREVAEGLDQHAALRSTETAIVILEPRPAPAP